MAETTYINGVNLKENQYGIKFSGKAETLIQEIKKHTNEKGYFNFEIMKRKEQGKYGETHFMKLDTYKPEYKPKPVPDNLDWL